jgi:hypothetical protein
METNSYLGLKCFLALQLLTFVVPAFANRMRLMAPICMPNKAKDMKNE